MKPKNIRAKNSMTKMKRIHKTLARDIENMKKILQKESDNRYGKNKVKITEVFASKVISRGLRKK